VDDHAQCGYAEVPARVRGCGHAAPVDTGSTGQRYAVPRRRVKPVARLPHRRRTPHPGTGDRTGRADTPRRAPDWPTMTCGQALDPRFAGLLASAQPRTRAATSSSWSTRPSCASRAGVAYAV
jgi:hypothetical protein